MIKTKLTFTKEAKEWIAHLRLYNNDSIIGTLAAISYKTEPQIHTSKSLTKNLLVEIGDDVFWVDKLVDESE